MLKLGAGHRSRRRKEARPKRRGAPSKAKTKSPKEEWTYGTFPSYLVVPDDEIPEDDKLQKFVIMIRGPNDPEDTAQGRRRRGERRAARGMLDWKDLNRRGLVSWKEAIWSIIKDGAPRTFNHLMVELCDRTADFCAGRAPETALWDLVYAKVVEHTMNAPILFRRADLKSEDGEVLNLDDPRIQIIGVPGEPRR